MITTKHLVCNQYCIILFYIIVQEINSSIKSDMSNSLEKEVDPGKSLFYCMSQLLQHN